jgi:hypothetical protein
VFGDVFSKYLTVIFSFSPFALYILLVNCVSWFHPENDASKILQIKENSEQRAAVNNFCSIQKELFEGKTYGEIPKEYFSFGVSASADVKLPLLLSALRRSFEIGDVESASALAQILESEALKLESADLDEIYCELLYKYILCGEVDKIKENAYILNICKDDNEPYFLRVSLAYAKYRGDEDYFNVLKPTALKICDKKRVCRGDVVFNERLIKSL